MYASYICPYYRSLGYSRSKWLLRGVLKMSDMYRAIDLCCARLTSAARLAEVEREIAEMLIDDYVLEKDEECARLRTLDKENMTDFQATEELGRLIAAELGVSQAQYSLETCADSRFRALWMARQVIELTGISYAFYIKEASNYLRGLSVQHINPTSLTRRDVQVHVMARFVQETAPNRV